MQSNRKSKRRRSPVTLPHAHRQVHKLADGSVRSYWYASRGGPALLDEDGRPLGFTAPDRATLDAADAADAPRLAAAWAALRNASAGQGTFAKIIEDYLCSPEYAGLAKDTKRSYRPYLDDIKATFGGLLKQDLKTDRFAVQVRDWRDNYVATSTRKADHALAVMKLLFGWARDARLLTRDVDPCAGIKKLYVAPPQDAWTQAMVDKAVSHLPKHVADVVILAANTGLRRTDLAEITWSAVDRESGKIRWFTSKGLRRRRMAVLRLTPQLIAALDRIGKKDSVTILNNALGRPYASPGALGTCFGDAMRKAKLKGSLHGLRRFAATNMSRQGHSSREMAKWLGWSEKDAEDMASIYVDAEAAAEQK